MRRRVVITGVGAVTALGSGASTLYRRWRDGESGIAAGLGACTEFEPAQLLTRKELRRMDRFVQLAVVAAQEALEQAGWAAGAPLEADRIACVIGTGVGGIGTIESQLEVLRESGPAKVSPLGIPLMMGNAGAANLALRHGFKGPALSTVSACAAGADAIGNASRLIRCEEADAAVAGGAEAGITSLACACFDAMGALSESGISRPFDARRDGFVMGEGAGVLVLESAELAEQRGAEVLGEVLGYGASADAYHLTAPDPSGDGAVRAIKRALDDAEVAGTDLNYINAHGTSTQLNDRSETEALKSALGGDVAARIPVSSTKSAVGHLLGAAGAVEAVATLLALRDRVAPPTLGYEVPEEGLDLDYVPLSARRLEHVNGRALALSNSFGFGGHNAVLCLAS